MKQDDLSRALIDLAKRASIALATEVTKSPQTNSGETEFRLWAALEINFATDGFLALYHAGKVRAARMLVRPMIEIALKAAAADHPGVFYRLAYSEATEESWMFADGSPEQQAALKRRDELRPVWQKTKPGDPLEDKVIKLKDLAMLTGATPIYELHYKLFCKYTHGALTAMVGGWDKIVDAITADATGVAWANITLLDTLTGAGVGSPASAIGLWNEWNHLVGERTKEPLI